MKALDTQELPNIAGGYHPLIFPAVGCCTGMTFTYINNPNAPMRDYGRNCLKGAAHGLNPAFGITGKLFTDPVAKYVAGVVYSQGSSGAIDKFIFRNNAESTSFCPVSFGDE